LSLAATEPLIIQPFSYQIGEPNQLTEHHMASTEVNWWYNDSSKLSLRIGQQINKRQEFDVRRNSHLPIIDLTLYTTDVQLDWKHPEWHGFKGFIGTQYFYQDNNNNFGTGTTPFIPNYNTTRLSSFIIENYAFHSSALEMGLRVDLENNSARGRQTNQDLFISEYSFENLTASVGFIKESSNGVSFRSNIGVAWRPPNMSELYSFGQHGFKNQFGLLRYYSDDNGNLKTDKVLDFNDSEVNPEKGYKWINELDFKKKRYSWKLTAYVNYIDNYIYQRPIGIFSTVRGVMPFYIIEQSDALLAGADFTYHYNLSKNLEGVLGGSYLWSKNIKKNESLINQPPVNINAKLILKTKDFWKVKQSVITLRSSYTFKQFLAPRTISPQSIIDGSVAINPGDAIFDFTDAPDGYFLLNASWGYAIGHFKGQLELRNILNQKYRSYLNEMRYFADEMGTNFLISINYTLHKK
jgi:iron complex outermembrane receptor protein